VRLVLIYSPPLSSDSLSPWCRSPTKSRAERPRRPHPRRWSDAAHVGQSSARKRALPAAPSPRSRISLAYTLYFFSRRGVICAPGTACAVNRNIYLEGFTRVKKKNAGRVAAGAETHLRGLRNHVCTARGRMYCRIEEEEEGEGEKEEGE